MVDVAPMERMHTVSEETVSEERGSRNWVAALRNFASSPVQLLARCELCGQAISDEHIHMIEPRNRRLVCACGSCGLRAEEDLDVGAVYLRIPDEIQILTQFELSDADWDALMIPIGLAFFVRSAATGRVIALYPGPAGAVESLLDLDAWESLVTANPGLATFRAEVEALLVYRVGEARRYYRASIDRCYALAGIIRKQWRGLSGGAEVWESIERLFAEFDAQAVEALREEHNA